MRPKHFDLMMDANKKRLVRYLEPITRSIVPAATVEDVATGRVYPVSETDIRFLFEEEREDYEHGLPISQIGRA